MTEAATPDRSRAAPRAPVPRLLVLTDRRRSNEAGRSLRDTVAAAVAAGAPAVLLREKDLATDERRELAQELLAVTDAHGARLLVAGDVALARSVGAAGVHLAAADAPVPQDTRRPGDDPMPDLRVGRSCHDVAEVAAAVAEPVDYVTISPVAATASKPGYGPALGPDGFARLAAVAGEVPALALGGIGPDDAGSYLEAGAHGVAVMGAVMGARDPAAVVARLLAPLAEEAPR